jgi:mannose-6-phosphate isomerase-like protein (cupin superfamily)
MRMLAIAIASIMIGTGSLAAAAQTTVASPDVTTAAVFNLDKLAEQGRALVDKARAGSGSAGIPLSRYQHSFTQLAVRTVDGGGELHKNYSDFLFVLDGEGTEMTGGTMINPKEGANGEVRGTTLEGAVAHTLHKGDMIHVPAGTNHQQLVAPGKYLVVYVIKVEEPA